MTKLLIFDQADEGLRTATPAEIDEAAGVTELRQQVITLEAKLKMRAGIDDPLISNLVSELKEAREQRDGLLEAVNALLEKTPIYSEVVKNEYREEDCHTCFYCGAYSLNHWNKPVTHDEDCAYVLAQAAIAACDPKAEG